MFQDEASISYSYSVSAAPSNAVSRAGAPDQGWDLDRERYAVFSLKLLHAFWGDKGLRDIYRSSNFELPQKERSSKEGNELNKKEEDDIEKASQIFVEKTTEFIFCRSPVSSNGAFREESVATLENLLRSWKDMDAVSPMEFFYAYDGKNPSTVQLRASSDNGYVRFESILARAPANVATSVFALKSASCELDSASGSAQLGLYESDADSGEKTFKVKEINIGGESFGQTIDNRVAGLDFSGKVYGAEEHHSNCFMIWLLGELGPQGLDRFLSHGADGSKTLCLKLGLKKKLDKAEQLLLFLVSQLDHQKTADYRRQQAEAQEGAAQREPPNVVKSQSAELLSRESSTPSGDDDDDGDFRIGVDLNKGAPSKNTSDSGLSHSSTPANEPPPSFSASLRQEDKEEEDEDADEEEDEEDQKEKERVEKKRQEWNQVNKAAGGYRTQDGLGGAGGIPRISDNEELTIRLTVADSKFILETYIKLCQEYGLLTLQRKEEEQPARLPALYFHVLGAGKKATVFYTLTGFFLQQPASSMAVPGASSAVTTADAGVECQWIEEYFLPTTLDSGLPESVCVVENPQMSFSKNDNAAGAVVETSASSCSFCLEFIAHRKCNDARLRSGDPAGQAPEQFVTLEDDEEDEKQGDQERGQIQSSSRCQCPLAPKGEDDSSSCHCASTNSHSCPRSLSQSKPGSSSDCSCCKSLHTSGASDGSSCTFCKLHSAKPSVVSVSEGECSCGGKSGSSSSKSGSVPCSACNRPSAEPLVVSPFEGECSCEKNSGSSSSSKSASGSCSACKRQGAAPGTAPGEQSLTATSGGYCKCSGVSEETCPGCKSSASGSNKVPKSGVQQPHGEFCHCSQTSPSVSGAAAVASENSSSALEECPFCKEGANNSSSLSYCACSSEASRSSGFQVIKASPTSSKKAVIRARRDYAQGQSCMIINLPVAF